MGTGPGYLSTTSSYVTASSSGVGWFGCAAARVDPAVPGYRDDAVAHLAGWSGAGKVAAAEERGSGGGGEDCQAGEPGGGGPVGLGGGDELDVVED